MKEDEGSVIKTQRQINTDSQTHTRTLTQHRLIFSHTHYLSLTHTHIPTSYSQSSSKRNELLYPLKNIPSAQPMPWKCSKNVPQRKIFLFLDSEECSSELHFMIVIIIIIIKFSNIKNMKCTREIKINRSYLCLILR